MQELPLAALSRQRTGTQSASSEVASVISIIQAITVVPSDSQGDCQVENITGDLIYFRGSHCRKFILQFRLLGSQCDLV